MDESLVDFWACERGGVVAATSRCVGTRINVRKAIYILETGLTTIISICEHIILEFSIIRITSI
jgi:hypothetical protein